MLIINASYVISSPVYEKCPKPDKPEYAFIGRSNVGKSSLINMICAKQGLAKTSSTPGKTQLINHFLIESARKEKAKREFWNLVDLPGYGYAKVAQKERKTWGKMIEDYIRNRENLVNVFVLIDSRHKPQAIDIDFLNALSSWQVPFTLVFTKADKEKPGAVKRNVDLFLDLLRENWQFLPQVVVSSATKRQGREELLDIIELMNQQLNEEKA